jgi:uracil-DNA glycosylase
MGLQFDLFNETHSDILRAGNYEVFRRKLRASGCERCALSQGRTQIVVDRGNPDAKLMFIGEGPGENEDKQGLAFVGRAGKLMDKMMTEIGLDTNQDAIIVNIVKCRPPGNRAPLKEEAETCMPFLKKQVALIKPKMIVLLGATALKHLVLDQKRFSMADSAGKMFKHPDFPGVDLMVLFHPAYLLYDPRKKSVMAEHLMALKTHLKL